MTTPQFTPARDFTQEEWRLAPGLEATFEVSNLGRVRRIAPARGSVVGAIVGVSPSQARRPSVSYRLADGQRRRVFVHILVARAFIGPIPPGHEVNHIDGNRHNNRASNLEFVTHKRNMEHASELRLIEMGEARRQAKLSAEAVRVIRRRRAEGESYRAIAEDFGVSSGIVRRVVLGLAWRHVAD